MKRWEYSFVEWCIDNKRQDILRRWDHRKNGVLLSEVPFKSNQRYFFRCPRGIHDSEEKEIQYLTSGRVKDLPCKKCKSFAQKIIDDYGEEYFNQVWNSNNDIDPWVESYGSNRKAYFNCLANDLHPAEPIKLKMYSNGTRCKICSSKKLIREESLGVIYPQVLDYWSTKNKKTPFEYFPYGGEKVYFKCKSREHEDYKQKIAYASYNEFRCPECSRNRLGISRRADISGLYYGDLFVIDVNEEKTREKRRVMWNCSCSCGNTKIVAQYHLHSGVIKNCGNKSIHYTGVQNGNWKGGITSENMSARTSDQYERWRLAVFEKDWFTCQCCGRSKDIEKHAHHINENFSEAGSRRYDVTNGMLLCKACHYTTVKGSFHNIYGTQNNTQEQLETYINNKRKELGIDVLFVMERYLNGEVLKPNMIVIE